MNNIKTRNKLFTLLLLVMALLIPQWGWAQTKASKGDGSSNNPFLITTAEELKWYASYVNGESGDNVVHNTACAKLMKDIDLSTVCGKDKGNWTPIAKYGTYTEDSGKNFEGVFDGNGHTISNLYINDENGSNCGLFGYIYLSTAKTSVHDLKMDNVQIVGKEDCAAVCGSGFLVTFENIEIISGSISGLQNVYGISGCNGNAKNCINRADVTTGSFYAAGVICNIKNGNKVSNCSNYGKITAGKGNAGGIASSSDGATKLENCANYGDIVLTKAIKNEVGGLVGAPWNLTINNCANFGNIYLQEKSDLVGVVVGTEKLKKASGILANTGKIYVGGVAQVDVPVLQSGISWSNNKVDNTATCLTPAAEDLASGLLAWQLQKNCSTQTWGQKVSVEPKDKYPVIGSEYKVYAGNVTFNCKTYKVMSGSFTNNATSSAFKYQHGQIDHHAATATCTKATKEYWQCQDCQRTYSDEPLTKELTDITQPALGHTYNYDGYCIRCKQYVDVKPSQKNGVYLIAEPYHLVWFRAYVNGTIVNEGEKAGTAHPTASAMLTANIDLKGYCYAADASQKLEELSWEPIGNITNPYKGTFDGNGKTISNLYINASQDNMGLFGHINQSTIKDLTLEDAKVTNTGSYTGILAGCARDDASTLQNIKISKTCQIQAKGDKSDYTGGIVGAFYGYAYNCVNYATVEGRQCVGGLFGKYSGTGNSITACANYGNITATRWNAGGLVGSFNYGTIQDCANYGYVEGKERVGGMAGHVYEGKIKNVFCYGSIRATEDTPSVGMALGYSKQGTTEGMVAYYSGATLTINDQPQEVRAFGGNTISEDNATGFTEEQLKSGKVAWLLNGSTSVPAEGETLAWYQKLGENGDKYPVLTQKDGNTVYNNYYTCSDKQVYENIFSNTEASEHEKYDKHDKGTETLLADGLYSSTCQRCQTNLMYIKDFCGIEGNDLELTADKEGNYKAKAVTLTDKAAYNSPVDFTADEVEYTRNNPHTEWQVYYVPFDIDCGVLTDAGITAACINNFHEYTKNGEKEVVLEVNEVTSGTLKANVPYVIKATQSGETQIQASNVMLHKAESKAINCQSVTHDYTFTGIYKEQSDFNQDENVTNGIFDYTLKGGLFYELIKTATLSPMRWYLTISNRNKATETPSAQPARVKSVTIKVVGEGEATGIENIHVITEGNAHVNQGIYDLQGRRLSAEPAHGIYIKNGKKYVK